MKSILILSCLIFSGSLLSQQPTLHISISRDTVLLGNAFYVQYTFDSKDGQFIAPDIKDGDVISQSFSSNTSIIDGEIKALHRQKYLIQPSHTGVFIIPGTSIKTSGPTGDIEVPQVQIVVKENPNQLEIDPEDDKDWILVDILAGKIVKRKTKKL
jgi:hypothetical protein